MIVGARETSRLGGLGVVAVATGTACRSSSVRLITVGGKLARAKGPPFVRAVGSDGWEGARGAGRGFWVARCGETRLSQ